MAGDEHSAVKNQKKLADAVRGKTGQYYVQRILPRWRISGRSKKSVSV